MQIYVSRRGFWVIGKAKDLTEMLKEYADHYSTVCELIRGSLQ